MIAIYIMNVYQALIGYCILYLKSNQDIIRSISRLDNLYLVSQFQIATTDDAMAMSIYSDDETDPSEPASHSQGVSARTSKSKSSLRNKLKWAVGKNSRTPNPNN